VALALALSGAVGCGGPPRTPHEAHGTARRGAALAVAEVAVVGDVIFDRDVYPRYPAAFPGGVTGLPDVTYATRTGFRPLTLDLYLPPHGPGAARRPFVVFVHGGAWLGGTKRTMGAFRNGPQVLAAIAARGYVVASVDYRLAGEAPFPAAVRDVQDAIRYLRAHADAYHVDEQRGAVWGASAGGQLASLVAVTCVAPERVAAAAEPATESGCVQAAVSWYAVADFRAATGPAERAFLRCETDACSPAERVREASPVAHVDRADPPFLLVHGVDDTTVPFEHSQALADALVANGVDVELVLLPGVGHGFLGRDREATRQASLTALERTLAFLDRTIGRRRTR